MPVLARPQNAQPLVDSIKATTTVPHNIVFLCSPEDADQIEACRATKAKVKVVPFEAGWGDYPKKMNFGYKATRGKYLFLGSDDITFHPRWDIRVLRVAEVTGLGVIGTNDMANKFVMKGHFSTHSLVRRSYVKEVGAALEGPGVLISESYDHNYCDRELCALAQSRGQWAFARNAVVQHNHPLWRKARWDATYHKGKKGSNADHENFLVRSEEWGYDGILAQERDYLRRATRRHARMRARGRK